MSHETLHGLILATALSIALAGCAADRQYDDYGLATVSDLNVTQANHPHGYTQTQCFVCHLPENIHRVDRIKAPSFPLAAQETAQFGLSSCAGCHGSNGVTP